MQKVGRKPFGLQRMFLQLDLIREYGMANAITHHIYQNGNGDCSVAKCMKTTPKQISLGYWRLLSVFFVDCHLTRPKRKNDKFSIFQLNIRHSGCFVLQLTLAKRSISEIKNEKNKLFVDFDICATFWMRIEGNNIRHEKDRPQDKKHPESACTRSDKRNANYPVWLARVSVTPRHPAERKMHGGYMNTIHM